MGNLKIGFVLDDTLDTPDGVQQYILTLGSWMHGQGHEVHYLAGRTKRTDIPNIHSLGRNIRVQFNGNRMSTPLPANRKRLRQLLETEQFDVLHVQMPYSPFLAHRIVKAASARTAIVGSFHVAPNSGLVTAANRLLGRIVRSSLRRFDVLLSASSAAADFAKKTHSIDTTILPNVVETSHFNSAQPFSAHNGHKTIVFLGRLVPRKGCQTLLDAVRIIRDDTELPAFKVIICGRGPLMGSLQDYTYTHGMNKFVEFAGFVDEYTKARYLRTADIAVFPSNGGECFGIVLLEAMAANHPVVLGADNPGYRSVLAPYPDVLFPPDDPGALADKLRLYLTDTAKAQKALAWQRRYIPQFDVAVVGSRLIAHYQAALHNRRNS